jgi:hypothetical protein
MQQQLAARAPLALSRAYVLEAHGCFDHHGELRAGSAESTRVVMIVVVVTLLVGARLVRRSHRAFFVARDRARMPLVRVVRARVESNAARVAQWVVKLAAVMLL